jgi:hypothetical protein
MIQPKTRVSYTKAKIEWKVFLTPKKHHDEMKSWLGKKTVLKSNFQLENSFKIEKKINVSSTEINSNLKVNFAITSTEII